MNDVNDIIKWCIVLPLIGLATIVLNHAMWVRMVHSEALVAYGIELGILAVVLTQVFYKEPKETKIRHNEEIREQGGTVDPMLVDREWDIDNWRG